jgi:hypothetical protein
MKRIPMRICENSDYDAQVTFLSSIVDRHRTLPLNPFLGTRLTFRFDEFDWAMSGEFWETVQCLAGQSLDDELILAVLDPDPVSYFKSNFGYYEWDRLPVDMTKQQYWDFINQAPADSPADSILGVAERIVWVPQTRNWCIWAERESGLCVLASSSAYAWGNSRGIDWALDWCRPWANTAYLEQFELNFKGR